MKIKINYPLLLNVLLVASVFMLSGCANWKHQVFEMAINHERDRANLTVKTITVNNMPITLLFTPMDKSKETMVLLHGFAANKEGWVRYAAEVTDQYNVIAVDLPGHGESIKDFSLNYRVADQVGYLDLIVQELNISRFHLAGNSMGGAITAMYSATFPDKVITAVLFNPAGIHDHESVLAKLLKKGENPLIVENAEDFDRLMEFGLEEKPFIPWPITEILAQQALANKEINHKIFNDIKSENGTAFKQKLTTIKAPTLILWGTEDRVINVDNSALFEKLIPNAQKIIFEDIGHAPMIEIPEKSANHVKTFIAGTKGA